MLRGMCRNPWTMELMAACFLLSGVFGGVVFHGAFCGFSKRNLDSWPLRMDIHEHETRNNKNVTSKFCRLKRTRTGHNFWCYKFINKLPHKMRLLPLEMLKNSVTELLVKQTFYALEEFTDIPIQWHWIDVSIYKKRLWKTFVVFVFKTFCCCFLKRSF